MELKRIDRFLLKALYLIAAGIVIMQTLDQGRITSVLFTMTFPLTVFLWLRSVRKTVTRTDIMVLMTVALSVVCVLIDAGIHNAGVSFSYLKKAIMCSMTLLFFQTAYRLSIDKETSLFIDRTVDCLVLYLMWMYCTHHFQMFWMNGRQSVYLTFRMSNPNLTGMYLACLYALELYRIFNNQKFFLKLVRIGMAAFLLVCVFQTQSRNALLVVLIFTAVCLWLVFRGFKRMNLGRLASGLIAAIPALFVAVYLLVIDAPWFNELLSFLVGEGKGLDSRVDIWGPAIEALKDSPLIGAYYTVSGGTGSSQMHNSHLDIAASYGIPVLVLVCVLLQRYLYQRGRRYNKKEDYICIMGFASILMLGIGEGGLFAGGLGIYIFVGAFLLLAGKNEVNLAEGT